MKELTIVIPVYTAIEQTVKCVESILHSDARNCNIILLDDASPGGVVRLAELANAHDNIALVSHIRNRGYTRNVQIGVELTDTEFVCILNSDTIVPSLWSEKLVSTMVKNPHLGGVGPLSNAASYQSIPAVKDNDEFSKNDDLGRDSVVRDQLNTALFRLFEKETIDVPILNGFCTVFRKQILNEIHGFDVDSFPSGYGEENDLCIRVLGAGFRLAVVPSVFVYHQKSQSFGHDRKAHLSRIGAKVLNEIYGSQHVPDLANLLETQVPLQALRKIGHIIDSLVNRCINITTALTELPAGHCVTFDENGRIIDQSSHESQYGKIILGSAGSLTICAPSKVDLYWFEGFGYETLTALLAFRSAIEPVLFELPYDRSDQVGEEQSKWLDDLVFDQLYESNFCAVA